VVGILVNLAKGAELILRPHQQKALQDILETITLRIDGIDLMKASSTPRKAAVLADPHRNSLRVRALISILSIY
jgi:hypothetical protein